MYDAPAIETKWNKYWSDSKLFLFDKKDQKRNVFVMDMPPPNTTGGLHMGHVFWTCYGDSIARYKKLKGYNVLYPIGWDEHGFPTEIETEKKFGRKLAREEFYKKCVEVSELSRKSMLEWMLKLGASFDMSTEYRTTDKDYTRKVQLSILMMYEKGMVYRGNHPIEWCVRCGSGISREQTVEKEEETLLNHVDFIVVEEEKKGKAGKKKSTITIATTRPELMHAAVALAVNPKDKRYSKLIGSTIEVPVYGNRIIVIGDELVDMEYGTGAEMICTFGDKRDINLYYKHKLKLIQALDVNGMLINAKQLDGTHVSKARALVIDELKKIGALKKQEKIKHNIKVHDRCSTPIELISTTQWFIKTKEYSGKIKETASAITWIPEHMKQRLDDWANFIEWDWAITRNRVFGTPMPFWYCEKCDYVVPPKKEELPFDPNVKKPYKSTCPQCGGQIVGTKETLDGWVDTSITSMVIAGWPDDKKGFDRLFPSAIRIQGVDIIRTWAFYTIFRTWALANDKPWEKIIVHGMILGTDGREMHKSSGNGVYPESLVPKYPADAIRLWVALSGGIGKDRPFSYAEMDYAKGFLNKLHNTANFVELVSKGYSAKAEPSKDLNVFDIWILNRLNETVKKVTESYDSFMLHEAMSAAVNFYWHEFADYYIENVKHRVYSKEKDMEKSKRAAQFTLRHVLETSLKIFAPVIPFLCEEINSTMNKGSIFEQKFPAFAEKIKGSDYVINGLIQRSAVDMDYENTGAVLNDVITEVRKEKAKNRLALNKEITAININVPDEYYNAVVASKDELKQICKAHDVKVGKNKDFSVSISI
ncbi:MAG: valine--tRNA ligase [Candidatus Micrarchaeales archaeon]